MSGLQVCGSSVRTEPEDGRVHVEPRRRNPDSVSEASESMQALPSRIEAAADHPSIESGHSVEKVSTKPTVAQMALALIPPVLPSSRVNSIIMSGLNDISFGKRQK